MIYGGDIIKIKPESLDQENNIVLLEVITALTVLSNDVEDTKIELEYLQEEYFRLLAIYKNLSSATQEKNS